MHSLEMISYGSIPKLYADGIKIIEAVQTYHNDISVLIAKIISDGSVFVFPAMLILILMWCSDYKKGFSLAYILIFSAGITTAIKEVLQVPRPFAVKSSVKLADAAGFSTPSGHSVTSSCFYPALLFYSGKNRKRKIAAAIILPLLTGFTRIYLGVHYPSDVVFGLALGFAVSLGFIFFRRTANTKAEKFFTYAEQALGKNPKAFKFALTALTAFALIIFCGTETAPCGSLMGLAFGRIYILEGSGKTFDASLGTAAQKVLRFFTGAVISAAPFFLFYFFEHSLSAGTLQAYLKLFKFMQFFITAAFVSGAAPVLFSILKLTEEKNEH